LFFKLRTVEAVERKHLKRIIIGPGTLWRTWGTRPVSESFD
jgi:hypothetical protein